MSEFTHTIGAKRGSHSWSESPHAVKLYITLALREHWVMRLQGLTLISIMIALVLPACATHMVLPTSRFEVPESAGNAVGPISTFGWAPTVGVFEKHSSLGSKSASIVGNIGDALAFNLGASLLDRLELRVRDFSGLSAKVQLLGSPKSRAESGNFSVALYGGTSRGTRGWGPIQDWRVYDGMLLAGYRFNPSYLLYGGVSEIYSPYTFRYAWGLKGTTRTRGYVAGLEYGSSHWRLLVEATVSIVQFGGANTVLNSWGLAFTGVPFLPSKSSEPSPVETSKDSPKQTSWFFQLGLGFSSPRLNGGISDLVADSELTSASDARLRVLRPFKDRKTALGLVSEASIYDYQDGAKTIEVGHFGLAGRQAFSETLTQGAFGTADLGIATIVSAPNIPETGAMGGLALGLGAGYAFETSEDACIDLAYQYQYRSLLSYGTTNSHSIGVSYLF